MCNTTNLKLKPLIIEVFENGKVSLPAFVTPEDGQLTLDELRRCRNYLDLIIEHPDNFHIVKPVFVFTGKNAIIEPAVFKKGILAEVNKYTETDKPGLDTCDYCGCDISRNATGPTIKRWNNKTCIKCHRNGKDGSTTAANDTNVFP